MTAMNRVTGKIALAVCVGAISVMTVLGQLPIPVPGQTPAQGGGQAGAQGQRGGGQGQRGGGQGLRGGQRGAPAEAEPVKQVVTPIPAAVEVTGPGAFFETFMDDHDDAK